MRNTGFRADYSLVYLDRLTTCYLDRNWKALMKCYTEEVVRLPVQNTFESGCVIAIFCCKCTGGGEKADGDIRPAMCGYCG